MCVWSFNEIIALLLCQGVAITVLLIMIHESLVNVHLSHRSKASKSLKFAGTRLP